MWSYMSGKYRSYMGRIWAIHKLYISHVQPTVQAPPIFWVLGMVHLWPVLQAAYVWPIYGPCMTYVSTYGISRSDLRSDLLDA